MENIPDDDFWQNSMCEGEYLHRFRIVNEYPQGVLEICDICGMDKFFRIIEGKVNNYEYMSWHVRQALPDFHPYYFHEHGYDPLSAISHAVKSPYA